ncbi:MAG: O-antigen ligase family protein [Candidatus Binatia bacterium]
METRARSTGVSRRSGPFAGWLAADAWPCRIDVALYALLAFAIAAFSREFTWLHVRVSSSWPYLAGFGKPASDSFETLRAAGLPIFVTEMVLALLVVCVAVRQRTATRSAAGDGWLDGSLVLWSLIGVYELARGFSAGPTAALRDFAIVYYAAFLVLARAICDSRRNVAVVCVAFWLGTVVSLTAAVLMHADVGVLPHGGWPQRGDFLAGNYGLNFLVAALVGAALWSRLGRRGRWILFVYLAFATFALVLTQQRGMIIAFAAGWSVLLVGRAVAGITLLAPWRMAAGAAAAGLILALARFGGGASAPGFDPVQQLIHKTGDTAVESATTGELELTGTARFRRDAWAEAWRRFQRQPLRGEGFGQPFTFFDTGLQRMWTADVRPHNAYLTVLYKMGVVGLAAFVLVHLAFYRSVWGALGRVGAPITGAAMWGLLSALVGMQVYACANLLFESPFLAVVYWSVMGLMTAVTRIEA